MYSELNNGERTDNSPPNGWLAGLMLRRGGDFLPRFAFYYRELAHRPRRWRRQFRRKLAITVTGAALLLALAGPVASPVWAAPEASINVVNGEVAITPNNKCSLMEAIWNARSTNAGNMKADCTAGNANGLDTVVLPAGGDFVLTAAHNQVYGPTGLPVITSAVTILGNGATIRRSAVSGTPEFRILAVDADGDLMLEDTTVRNGNTQDYQGGGILNKGQLIVVNSTIRNNSVYHSGGGIANEGILVVTDSRIIYNTGTNGGAGIYNTGSAATITGSLIAGNWAFYYGGGIENYGDMTITNSTVSGNSSGENGAGGIVNGYGAALTLNNVTVSENYTEYDGPGGIVNEGELTFNRSVTSGNFAVGYYDDIYQSELANRGTITANNRNVFGHSGDSGVGGFTPGATDIVPSAGLAAILSPLADNGGPTLTHALPPGSPALDLAPNASCAAAPVNGVDQRGEPRNTDGDGSAGNNECDAGSYELQPDSGGGGFLISPSAAGEVGGVAFAPADILKYDPATGWSMFFDGSEVGVNKNLSAFELLDNGDILMSFAANQPTPAGTFAPQDVARFDPSATGPNTAGTFAWELDGSTRFLSTSGEKIDALGDVGDGRLAISTAGAAAVQLPNGNPLKGQDEDALGLNRSTQNWSAYFDGTSILGLKAEDVNALWIDPATGDIYISIVGSFNLGGVNGNGKDIVKLTVNPTAPGGYTPSLWWDGSAAGFPVNIDGLEMVP